MISRLMEKGEPLKQSQWKVVALIVTALLVMVSSGFVACAVSPTAYGAPARASHPVAPNAVVRYPSGVTLQLFPDAALTQSYTTYNGYCPGYRTPTLFVRNTAANRNLHLAQNFQFGEFVHANVPYVVIDPGMVQHVQNIRAKWGGALYLTSGYRTPYDNHITPGSARCSAHTYGLAVDIAVSSYSMWLRLRSVALTENPGYVEPWTPSAPHLHVDWGPRR